MLKLMSFNLHHGVDHHGWGVTQQQAEKIKNTEIDVVFLQELDRHVPRSGLVDQLSVITHACGMDGRFARTMYLNGGEYGIAVLINGEVIEETVIPIAQHAREKRCILHIRAKINDKEYNLFGSHFPLEQEERVESLIALREYIDIKDISRVVFGGDLNLNIPADLLKDREAVLRTPELKEISRFLRVPELNYTTLVYNGKNYLVDAVFTDRTLKIERSYAEKTDLSDHSILYSEIDG